MSPNTISPIKSLRWYYSVSLKMARIVPGYTLTLIALTLASQMTLLAASFLPLKAILLIGSPDIPAYFPETLKVLGRDTLFLILSCSTAIAYFLHLTSEKFIKTLTDAGSQSLLANSSKMVLFQEQTFVANRAYLRFTRSLASVVFVAFTIFLLGLLYNDLILAIILLWSALIAGYFLTQATQKTLHKKIQNIINETPSTVASLCFLAAFGFMAYDFLDDDPPQVFAALISLLLTRQLMQRVALLLQDTTQLFAQKLQVSALFFHSHKIPAHTPPDNDGFWEYFGEETKIPLIESILSSVTGDTYTVSSVLWHQVGVHDVAAFEVSAKKQPGSSTRQFLIKIFNTNRSTFAINEATLFAHSNSEHLPTLPFMGAVIMGRFHCHLFEWDSIKKCDPLNTKEPTRQALKRLMCTSPGVDLFKLFSRSHPLIWERLSVQSLHSFSVASNMTCYASSLKAFLDDRANILGLIKGIPLQVANFDIGKDHLLENSSGEIIVSHWGLWSLEPVGAGWPTSPKELERLPFLFEEVKTTRGDMAHISFSLFKLSVLLCALDRFLIRQHFIYAAQLLPDIMNTYHQLTMPVAQETLQCPVSP
jgi:hypothetical protein